MYKFKPLKWTWDNAAVVVHGEVELAGVVCYPFRDRGYDGMKLIDEAV